MRAAQAAVAVAAGTDKEAAATERLAAANKHLALSRAAANASMSTKIGDKAFLGKFYSHYRRENERGIYSHLANIITPLRGISASTFC